MAHLIETIAYAGVTPWHGLGSQNSHLISLSKHGQSKRVWTGAFRNASVRYMTEANGISGSIHTFP